MPAILDGIRAGHVFVDVQGTRDRMHDLTAHSGDQSAEMGDAVTAPGGSTVQFTVSVAALMGVHVEIIAGGELLIVGNPIYING